MIYSDNVQVTGGQTLKLHAICYIFSGFFGHISKCLSILITRTLLRHPYLQSEGREHNIYEGSTSPAGKRREEVLNRTED